MTGEVRLDYDTIGQMGFRTRPNHQIWPVVWPQRVVHFNGGGIGVGSDTICEGYLGNVGLGPDFSEMTMMKGAVSLPSAAPRIEIPHQTCYNFLPKAA